MNKKKKMNTTLSTQLEEGYGPLINFQELDDARCKSIQDGYLVLGTRGALPPTRDSNLKVAPRAAVVMYHTAMKEEYFSHASPQMLGMGNDRSGESYRTPDFSRNPRPCNVTAGPIESGSMLARKVFPERYKEKARIVGKLVAESKKIPTLTEEEEIERAGENKRLIPVCQFCGKPGHAASTCKKRKNKNALPLPPKPLFGAEGKIQDLWKGKHKLNKKDRATYKELKKELLEETKTKKKNMVEHARKQKERK